MAFELNSSCKNNQVYILDFTNDDDTKVFQKIYRDHFLTEDRIVPPFKIASKGEMDYYLDEIFNNCQKGAFPIIVFEGHGVPGGLWFGEKECYGWRKNTGTQSTYTEIYSWDELYLKMRKINIACANNLILLFSTCFGAYFIAGKPILSAAAPFYYGAGPTDKISGPDLYAAYLKFFEILFEHDDIIKAVEALDSASFKVMHSEELIVQVFILFCKNYCRGSFHRKRVERLVSEFRMIVPESKQPPLSQVRKFAKTNLRDTKASWEKYKNTFLLGSDPRNMNRYNFDPVFHLEQYLAKYGNNE
jgi:hypothetical protein